jgi:hypothetical protein
MISDLDNYVFATRSSCTNQNPPGAFFLYHWHREIECLTICDGCTKNITLQGPLRDLCGSLLKSICEEADPGLQYGQFFDLVRILVNAHIFDGGLYQLPPS